MNLDREFLTDEYGFVPQQLSLPKMRLAALRAPSNLDIELYCGRR